MYISALIYVSDLSSIYLVKEKTILKARNFLLALPFFTDRDGVDNELFLDMGLMNVSL